MLAVVAVGEVGVLQQFHARAVAVGGDPAVTHGFGSVGEHQLGRRAAEGEHRVVRPPAQVAGLASLSTAAGSLNGKDTVYAEGWSEATTPVTHLYGTPDVNGDDIPDIWALASDGSIALHTGGRNTIGDATTVQSAASEWGVNKLTFG
ncbi:hypothetical protein [Streptomyces blattellae]|uniref:hypothetical protein n=1 Tax=Streptomyces blattellae TaxID=2569855 RepID=UPI001E3C59C8|nr:hypothetical protein [Streptomyces blattellae]